ncbi:pyruvate:ferredoxin (flavodoxin) oxidoreductase [Pseudomonadota bacterium]
MTKRDFSKVQIIGGRYGLSSKEFTPGMVKAIFDEMDKKDKAKNHFTVGINDDITYTSLKYNDNFQTTEDEITSAIFFGLGSDGTVGANKNTIKIIGEKNEYFAQAYFLYDSKKAGSVTESHLRFGKKSINASYLVQSADFIACHQFSFLHKIDILHRIKKRGTLLINSNFAPEEVWTRLPRKVQEEILNKKVTLYAIDGYKVAKETGMGNKINTIMQTCFFAIANVIDKKEAIKKIKESIHKTYAKKGEEVVKKNIEAVDKSLENLHKIKIGTLNSKIEMLQSIHGDNIPVFVKDVIGKIIERKGDQIPVSLMPCDGTFPSGTARYEKRGISELIAVWDPAKCVQCGSCVFACPHSAIRAKVFDKSELKNMPKDFKYIPLAGDKTGKKMYAIQISPQDCTGCTLCLKACPLKAIPMKKKEEVLECEERKSEFFNGLDTQETQSGCPATIKTTQFDEPLFEFSGACVGCGEIPYLKLVTQFFGDRMYVANATGCSSIFGGNLPTTPWSCDKYGRGPAWSNSLFEDNAEFGFGFKLSEEKQKEFAQELLLLLKKDVGEKLTNGILKAKQTNKLEIEEQRKRIKDLKKVLKNIKRPEARHLEVVSDFLVQKSVWIIGGDGWAYDIGYGGLDHVIASGKNVNILVLDTEVYSNTGGQASKATPLGAVAKFAASGKRISKKDLGLIAMTYGDVYVASIAIRANSMQAIKAIQEAESYDGPSLIIAYSSCIAHGIDMKKSDEQQKNAVKSGYWPLYRYDPRLEKPMQIDSKEPTFDFESYMSTENRFNILMKSDPKVAKQLIKEAEKNAKRRLELYKKL